VSVHESLLKNQREFFFIGGMPEAVQVYSDTKSFEEVMSVQNSICNTYIDDFSKYAQEKELESLQRIFRTVPGIISQNLKYTNLLPDEKSSVTRKLLELLIKAQVIRRSIHSASNGIPLESDSNSKYKKLFFLDIGLSNRILQTDMIEIQSLLSDNLLNEGSIAEQFISQHLYFDHSLQTYLQLYHWLNTGKNTNAEVDFIVSRGRKIVPVEVKSGKSGTLKSLHHFMYMKNLEYAIRFDLNSQSYQKIDTKISLGAEIVNSKYN
jgi:predicted AAA+ superfamily ATPase